MVGLLAQQTDQQSTATLKRLLLSVLGDLEEVWADQALQDTLMRLPLTAMVMLMGFDELKVASEDTVLYTADTYLGKVTGQQRQAAQQLLAPLVRAQHLSQFWLSAAALSPSAPTLLHGACAKQLRQLVLLKASVGNISLKIDDMKELIPAAPDSWVLGKRSIREVPTVKVAWCLDVSTLASTAQLCASQQKLMTLHSPSRTPPIGGLVFGIMVQLSWQSDEGCTIGLYAKPKIVSDDTYLQFDFELSGAGNTFDRRLSERTPVLDADGRGWGWKDFFKAGPMSGGWDAAAWAKAGLPTTGELMLKLRVKKVTHSLNSC